MHRLCLVTMTQFHGSISKVWEYTQLIGIRLASNDTLCTPALIQMVASGAIGHIPLSALCNAGRCTWLAQVVVVLKIGLIKGSIALADTG